MNDALLLLVSDIGRAAIYLSLVGSIWVLPLYALRLPTWLAPLGALPSMPYLSNVEAIVVAMPLAALVCALVARVIFARAWALQLIAVLVMLDVVAATLLVAGWSAAWLASALIGFSVGLAQFRSIQGAINRAALAAAPVVVAAICVHPAMWGFSIHGPIFNHYVVPLLCLTTLGVGTQLGAAVHRRIREQDLSRDARVATREIDALISRMGWGAVPA